GAAEVGVDGQPGALAHRPLQPCGAQLLAALGGAAVLPDQRPVQGLAGLRVPGDHGLALVGDADRVEPAALDAGVGERLAGDPPRHLPDLGRVVLDPAGAREVLLELRVGAPGEAAVGVEDEAGAAGRPLVDGEDHFSPGRPALALLSSWRAAYAGARRRGRRGVSPRRG